MTGRRECVVIRTGAFGDALMASAVFPGLAAAGYRLTMATSTEGEEVLRHDPYLEGRFRVWNRHRQDKNWPAVWEPLEQEFDRVVNLVNGMECSALLHPNQLAYYWPADQRRAVYGRRSYLGQYLAQAGLEGPARIRFVPCTEEVAWAERTLLRIGPCIVWGLRGSTPHKVYPYVAHAVTQVLAQTDAAIVLSGDLGSRVIESAVLDQVGDALGPAGQDRVFSLVGDGSIRKSLTLAQHARVVVAPETVLPMAVAHEPHVRKVVLLSHSSPANLTDDWIATEAITPEVPCYPCHRIHYDFSRCPQHDRTKLAACASSVPPHVVADAVVRAWRAGRES